MAFFCFALPKTFLSEKKITKTRAANKDEYEPIVHHQRCAKIYATVEETEGRNKKLKKNTQTCAIEAQPGRSPKIYDGELLWFRKSQKAILETLGFAVITLHRTIQQASSTRIRI